MIRYALICDLSHEFESWFPSVETCDEQIASGLLTCPICNSGRIVKQIMAPSVARSGEESDGSADSTAFSNDKALSFRSALREFRNHIVANSEDVGERFPEMARKIHYGETKLRAIHGESSLEEARALIEEGIDVHPLPFLPEDRN